jgi:hypothetical protein
MRFASCLPPKTGVVHQLGMGGLGDPMFGMPRFSRCQVGRGRQCRKRKQEAEGTALWKCDEQRSVYVITVAGGRRWREENGNK